ncbi:MAG TPA: cache domain-containing protein, partial [Rectinemataceae bacterium]|nr:cache domain-containing protein [Rectinemataceae bacterium]
MRAAEPEATTTVAGRLRLGLIGAVLISLLVTGGVLVWIAFSQELDQVRRDQAAVARLSAEKISAYVDELQRKLGFLARIRGLTEFDRDSRASLLEGLAYQNKAYEALGITDGGGRLSQGLYPGGEALAADWSGSAAYRRAVLLQEDFVGPVELEAGERLPSLLLAVPVRNGENRVGGMLVARVGLKYLWAVLDENRVGRSGYSYVVDQRGFIVAQTGDLPRQFSFGLLPGPRPEARPDRRGLAGPAPYQGLRGEAVIGEHASVQATNWTVVSELPLREAYAPLGRLAALMAAGLALGLVCSILIGGRLALIITRPREDLTLAAIRLRHGELGTRVAAGHDRELRVLAEAFNHMAQERMEVEGALRASEARYRSLFDSSMDAILLTITDGRVLEANPAACSLFGRSLEEIQREGRSGMVDSSDQRLALALEERARTGRFFGELSFIRINGERFPVELSSTTFDGADGGRWTLIIFRDITERKRAEEAMWRALKENQELLAELQHRVKNSMNMIASMISLSAQTREEAETKAVLDELEARVRAVAELYSLLYSSASFSELRLDEYCGRICSGLAGLSDRVEIMLDMERIQIPAKHAASIGLIVTELITNALKYAF